MSSGTFGSIRPANIDPSKDAEIFYTYRPTRSTEDGDFNGAYKTLDANQCLIQSHVYGSNTLVDGVYDVRLPLDKFNKKGFYTLYITPKKHSVTICDVSVLVSYPDVKGIVFQLGADTELSGISDLTGYRIDFSNGESRLIKSCNKCAPMSVSVGDGYPKAVRYNLVAGDSNFYFCTVTPSAAPSFKPNAYPYIGVPGEVVDISNTLFTPKMIEIEMVDHDADTISYMLEGDQIRDRDNGIITTYNEENEIYQQYDYYTIKSKLGVPLYDVKKNRENIDFTQSHDDIINM